MTERNIFELDFRSDGWYVTRNGVIIDGPYVQPADAEGARVRAERADGRQMVAA